MPPARDDVEELDLDDDGGGPWSDPEPAAPAAPPRAPAARRRRRLLVGVVVVALLVAGAVVRQAVARQDEGPALDGSATAAELFPQLQGAPVSAGAGDPFPTEEASAALDVVPGSAHLLAATGDLLFWVAQDSGGGVCLVVRRGQAPLRLGGECALASEAASSGVSLPAGDGVGATLVPDGFDAEPLRRQGYAQLGQGLWVDGETADQVVSDAVGEVAARPVVPVQTQTGDGRLPVFLTQDGLTYAVVLACLGSPEDDAGAGGGGLAVDDTAGLVVDGAPAREDCSTTPAFRRFTGDGGPVRVDVEVPTGVRWAARVVECEGSLRGPVCDRGSF